jgi:predicted transcriptional regulator
MINSVSLSPDVYTLLRQRAQQVQTSPDALANEALRQYLSLEELAWRQSLESLIARVQARTAKFSSEEIEADITAAAEEVRESRRARRSAG